MSKRQKKKRNKKNSKQIKDQSKPSQELSADETPSLSNKNQYVNLDIPVYDMFEFYDLDDNGDLESCLEEFLRSIESGYYVQWDAVIREEKGLPLTDAQDDALSELISFVDDDYDEEEPVLYINEIPRPKAPWYESVKNICQKMVVEPIKTSDIFFNVTHEGWDWLVACLEEYGEELSLPEGISTPIEVIPIEIRHKLNLQSCFAELIGLGQEDELTLENRECEYQIVDFIDHMKQYRESVDYFGLSLSTLFEKVILPPKDEKILKEEMMKRLNIKDKSEKISKYL
jgi:hypothetical protein